MLKEKERATRVADPDPVFFESGPLTKYVQNVRKKITKNLFFFKGQLPAIITSGTGNNKN